jgi:hypothetical protein
MTILRMRKTIAGVATAATFGTAGLLYGDAQINPYTDRGSHYELPLKADIPQGERVEIAKD